MSVTLPIYNLDAKKVKDFEYLPFGEKLTDTMVAQVMRSYIFNQHQGTAQAKTRGEITRPDKKPWAQKGTGRARHGSKNSPIWVGGGVTFGPRAYQKRLTISTALKQKAMRYFLDTEITGGSVVVLEDVAKNGKTKEAQAFVEKVNAFKIPVIVVLQAKDEVTAAMFRNLKNVKLRRASMLSPLDMNKKALYVFAESALNALVERIKKHDA